MNPTYRQAQILTYIRDHDACFGYAPTIREIGWAFEIHSPNGVVCHLKALEKKGLIQRARRLARTIRPADDPSQLGQARSGLRPKRPNHVGRGSAAVRPSERQLEVFAFIASHQQDQGYPPTVRDIADHLGIRSPSAVVCHLDSLEKAGLIERVPYTARGLRIVAWPSGELFPAGRSARGACNGSRSARPGPSYRTQRSARRTGRRGG